MACDGSILKIASFIIGYLHFVGALIITVLSIVGLIALAAILNNNGGFYDSATLIIMVISSVLTIFLILDLAFATVLIVGLHMEQPGHLKAYMIYSVIFLVIFIIDFIVTATIVGAITVESILFHVLPIALGIFFLLVIRSRYYEMKDSYHRRPAAAVYYAT